MNEAGGPGFRHSTHRNRTAMDGVPELSGQRNESGRLLPQTMPTLATIRPSRRWGTRILGWLMVFGVVGFVGCRGRVEDSRTVVALIESSPNNLDLRQGTDAQSERVGGLIFDALVKKDEHFVLQPWLATSWEQPDALTWVFHLRDGVRFQDGRALGAEDVAWTIRSMIDAAVGGLITAKGGAFASIDKVEVMDRLTPAGAVEEAGCRVAVQYERWVVWGGAGGSWKGLWAASGGVGGVQVCECSAG